jgi:general secretion pathway protein I
MKFGTTIARFGPTSTRRRGDARKREPLFSANSAHLSGLCIEIGVVGVAPWPRLSRGAGRAAFTLVEVLAALMFMAIVIPVAVEALHVASVSGEVAVRKAEAARVADSLLNQTIVTTNWNQSGSGTTTENGHSFQWSLRTQAWPADPNMQLLTAEISFSAQGRNYAVDLSTLENQTTFGTGTQ